jgi:hypothetical protein
VNANPQIAMVKERRADANRVISAKTARSFGRKITLQGQNEESPVFPAPAGFPVA